jgi:O-antigen ligase
MRLDTLISEKGDGIGLWSAVQAIVVDGRDVLKAATLWERGAHIFWLLGPFFLLIERTPSDIWLSVIALSFVLRSIVKRDWAWLKTLWVRVGFVFWICCLLSAALSPNPSYSIAEAFVWFRFPLFAMATAFWLARDKRLLYAMLLMSVCGLLVMCGILAAELIIVGQQNGRLTWPYGDPLPGSYVAKAGLPVFTIMVALAVSVSGRLAIFSGVFALMTLVISLMTGERVNFLIRACGGMLAGLLWRPRWGRYFWLVFVEVLAVLLLFRFVPAVRSRFVNGFVDQLPTDMQSPYVKAMMPALEAFLSKPFFGIGPGNFEEMCVDIVAGQDGYACHPHPHNFYVQLLAETGALGFVLGSIFFGSIVWTCFSASLKNKSNVFASTAWIVPFGLFWPIASTADFFGQWNNIFLWSAVALGISSVNIEVNTRVCGVQSTPESFDK